MLDAFNRSDFCLIQVFAREHAFAAEGVDTIAALPLFPQYASASTGSAAEKIMTEAGARWAVPSVQVLGSFFDHPGFINAVCEVAREHVADADHVVLSFHGVPVRHCTKTDPTGQWCSKRDDCCDALVPENRMCYRAQSFATARATTSSRS